MGYGQFEVKITPASVELAENEYDLAFDLESNGWMLEGVDDTTPMAWDAGWHVDGGDLIIEGSADSNSFGSVVIRVPRCCGQYRIYCEYDESKWAKVCELKSILRKKDYIVTGGPSNEGWNPRG